jgi:UDP-GlcNAc:undecaprenyl-phosphate GlcNAc-1-phosphate transferase
VTVCWFATPLAIALARRLDVFDHPRGYRQHWAPTPLFGGAAVLVGFLAAAVAVGGTSGRLLVLLGCAVGLCALGTIDDWVDVAPQWRVLAEACAALALVGVGLGWRTNAGHELDLVLAVVWVVGVVNAFNLMDNLNGACGSVACVSSLGIGALAAIHGQGTLAGLGFALAGASASFLKWNLSCPAKIFLGDGGSMAIGFVLAALGMAVSRHLGAGDANLLVVALMVGVVILDTMLVSISRLRRGVSLLTGGRDHLSHRLLPALGSAGAVAATLASVQAALCAVALVAVDSGAATVGVVAAVVLSLGLTLIAVLDQQTRASSVTDGLSGTLTPATANGTADPSSSGSATIEMVGNPAANLPERSVAS